MATEALQVGFNTPFQAQVDFLRDKLRLPTERWDDIQRSAHDRAFVVAGAAQADLLADLHQAVIKAAEQGTGLQAFRRDFKQIVAKHGWTGFTGDGSREGIAWRTRVIFQTNMSTSFAAGRYKQLTEPGFLALNPYWRYIHSDSVMHPRPLHLSWHGLTLLHSHPFWVHHFAPNGWGCMCRITAASRREGEASARAGLGEPPAGWDKRDARTGAPVGIDKGFDYTPGAASKRPLQELVEQKLLNLNGQIGAQMWQSLKPVLAQERLASWQAMVDGTVAAMQASGNTLMVHTVEPATVAALSENGVALENAAVWMRDVEVLHAMRAAKAARGSTLPLDVLRNLPELLDTATPYLDTQDQALIYTIDLGERLGKVVVRVNYNEKGRFDGIRERRVSNFVQTGGIVDRFNLAEARYLELKK